MTELIEYKILLQNPERYFKEPEDVVNADSLDQAQKIDILKAWESQQYYIDQDIRSKVGYALSQLSFPG
ncbi:MAG TPA: hypothetical protein VGL10_10210 [Gammaproteobacteria bacterium]